MSFICHSSQGGLTHAALTSALIFFAREGWGGEVEGSRESGSGTGGGSRSQGGTKSRTGSIVETWKELPRKRRKETN